MPVLWIKEDANAGERLVKKWVSWRCVAPLVILWFVVCPGFWFGDMVLSMGKVDRWMEREGITPEDLADIRRLERDIARGDGDPFTLDFEEYVKNKELVATAVAVAGASHEVKFLWDYQRWEYQKPISRGLWVLTVLVLVTKELVDNRGR